jgi:hypothetical protein
MEQMLVSQGEETRTWTVWGSSREELLHRVTLIFAEHIHEDDEVHVAYNAMQSGWRDQTPSADHDSTVTALFFEYSALIVIRRGARRRERQLTEAIWALVERLDRP